MYGRHRWVDSTRAEGRLAYARYVAALDREEHAARVYASQIERVAALITQFRG